MLIVREPLPVIAVPLLDTVIPAPEVNVTDVTVPALLVNDAHVPFSVKHFVVEPEVVSTPKYELI
jgi:hypothetical protein